MEMTGVVASGLGRAQIFMAQTHYQDQFREILGATAWPGTLNIELSDENLERYRQLRFLAGLDELEGAGVAHPVRVHGFEREGRSFGGATAFLAMISKKGENWCKCAILIPDLTRHTETAEIIASSFLRELLPHRVILIVQSNSNMSLISTNAMFLHLWNALGSVFPESGITAVDGNSDDQDSGASW
jgi:CTP-dependent riboflavin kinase